MSSKKFWFRKFSRSDIQQVEAALSLQTDTYDRMLRGQLVVSTYFIL